MVSAALSVAFLLSGAAGLIFQVVWFHRAGLVFGSSIWAVTIVLSSFMGGLALGNALAGRYALKVDRPLTAYGWLETMVATIGLAVTLVLPHVTILLIPLTRALSNSLWAVNLVRLAAAFCLLVVPATAMGATFPVVVGAVSDGRERFGAALGRLYGWNTLGAVLGVMAAELVLVDRFGVAGAAWVAAGLNVLAASLALSVAGRLQPERPNRLRQGYGESRQSSPVFTQRATAEGRSLPTSKNSSAVSAVSAFPLRTLLACAFLAGMALLALEVVWFRFLTMYVLSTTLAASLMLEAEPDHFEREKCHPQI